MDTDRFDADLRDRLGRSFGDGPSHRPLDDRLVAGHRALFRRRIGTSLAALAVVVVVGSSYALAGGNDRAIEPPGPATATSPSPDPAPSKGTASEPITAMGPWAEFEPGGIAFQPGTTILQRTENPLGYAAPSRSVGLRMVKDGEEQWFLMGSDEQGRTAFTTSDVAGERFATFDDWLADQVQFQKGALEKSPVSIAMGSLAVTAGVTLLEKVKAPAEAAAYGPVEDAVAAKIRLPDGRIRFALVLEDTGPSGTTVVDPAVLDAPTMAAFLRHLAAQGASGEGLR
ncbi:hypothetical protein [Nocardioides sp. InS609-2]|uniref:hypothetical protein n=1 Tax=Nocardioides sp. InS609-2 TaxID=2760705 RepID=UPI0020BD576A|nr:hypothetical protein [Nocardioides sp. InS609-2]